MANEEFIECEHKLLREQLQLTIDNNTVYENLLFNYLKARIDFDSTENGDDVIMTFKIPELIIRTPCPGESLLKLFIKEMKDKQKTKDK